MSYCVRSSIVSFNFLSSAIASGFKTQRTPELLISLIRCESLVSVLEP